MLGVHVETSQAYAFIPCLSSFVSLSQLNLLHAMRNLEIVEFLYFQVKGD